MSMFKKNFATHSGYRTFCALTNQFRHSTTAKEELKNACGKQILLSSSTRWASQIVAIGRFSEVNSTLNQLLGEVATESRNSGLNSGRISANSFLDQMLNRVRSATTVGGIQLTL
uniref:Uncharacterized protein n=1 Tax=Ditylenchus dipsaci TaxID=166011 RepID=A0A915D1G1_9BILA